MRLRFPSWPTAQGLGAHRLKAGLAHLLDQLAAQRPARTMNNRDGGPKGGSVSITPFTHGVQDRPKVKSFRGEFVVISRRMFLVAHSFQHPRSHQGAKSNLQDVCAKCRGAVGNPRNE